jgi:hypothetical protein
MTEHRASTAPEVTCPAPTTVVSLRRRKDRRVRHAQEPGEAGEPHIKRQPDSDIPQFETERTSSGSAGNARSIRQFAVDWFGGQSRKTTLRRELCTFKPPLYSMNPSFRNLFMKKFTRERVVPTISASVSWDTRGSVR